MFSPVPMDIHGHQGLADRIEMHPFSRQAFLETSIGQQRKRPQAGVIPKTAWRLADDFPQTRSGHIIEGSLIVMASTRTRLETGCAALIEGMQDIAHQLIAQAQLFPDLAGLQLLVDFLQDNLATANGDASVRFQPGQQGLTFSIVWSAGINSSHASRIHHFDPILQSSASRLH